MKRVVLPIIFLLGISLLFALESEPSDVVGFVKYDVHPTDWNMVAIPMSTDLTKAAELLAAVGDSITDVAYWNNSTHMWKQYSLGGSESGNYDIGSGKSLLVKSQKSMATSWYSAGNLLEAATFDIFANDWNQIYVPLNRTDITKASELLDAIGPDATDVAFWNNATHMWKQFSRGGSALGDFDLAIGQPVMVKSTSEYLNWNATSVRNMTIEDSSSNVIRNKNRKNKE